MGRSEASSEDIHSKNKEQVRKRVKRQRRKIGGIRSNGANKVWLRTRRRVRKGLFGR